MTHLVGVVDEKVSWRGWSSVAEYEAAACSSRNGRGVPQDQQGASAPK